MTSAFAEIIKAITPFGLPHAPDVYEGKKKDRWFVYNYADDRGTLDADDEPSERLVSLQLHLYMPGRENFLEIKERVRESIFATGEFTYPSVTNLGVTDGKRHIVFEFDGVEERTEKDGI